MRLFSFVFFSFLSTGTAPYGTARPCTHTTVNTRVSTVTGHSLLFLLFILASDDSGNDSLGIDDPDLLDIPSPMTYEAWSVDDEECGAV